jgi:uncharacterized membrane protein
MSPSCALSNVESLLRPRPANVGETERWLSGAVGIGALFVGTRIGGLKGLGLGALGMGLLYRGASGYCSLYDALDVNSVDHEHAGVQAQAGARVSKTVEIEAPIERVFAFWRNFENLPRIMQHLRSVKSNGEGKSTWEARGPLGTPVSWEAQVINERPYELIAWQSVAGSRVDTAGSVHFHSLGEERTRIRVSLKYSPLGGKLGIALAELLGQDAEQMIEDDLHRLKDALELHLRSAGQKSSELPTAAEEKR